jgi:hypothetical protein
MLAVSDIQRSSHADRLEANGIVALAHEGRTRGKKFYFILFFILDVVVMDVVNIRLIFVSCPF